MKDAEIEAAVRAIRWPAPGSALRARVLATPLAARQAAWADRIWFSRAWRSAAAAILVLAISIAWLNTPRLDSPVTAAPADAQSAEETGGALGLPADVSASLVRRTLDVSPRPPGHERRHAAFDLLALDGDAR